MTKDIKKHINRKAKKNSTTNRLVLRDEKFCLNNYYENDEDVISYQYDDDLCENCGKKDNYCCYNFCGEYICKSRHCYTKNFSNTKYCIYHYQKEIDSIDNVLSYAVLLPSDAQEKILLFLGTCKYITGDLYYPLCNVYYHDHDSCDDTCPRKVILWF